MTTERAEERGEGGTSGGAPLIPEDPGPGERGLSEGRGGRYTRREVQPYARDGQCCGKRSVHMHDPKILSTDRFLEIFGVFRVENRNNKKKCPAPERFPFPYPPPSLRVVYYLCTRIATLPLRTTYRLSRREWLEGVRYQKEIYHSVCGVIPR